MKPKELLENMDPLLPADFFSYRFSIPHAKDLENVSLKKMEEIPSLSNLLDEVAFGSISLAWSEEGIAGKLTVKKPFEGAFFPEYAKGDSLEVFIDTRDHKKSSFASRFCHHFVFLAGEVNGIQAEEVTRFRSEDSHPLCSSSDLKVLCKASGNSYELSFIIKESALHGYDPSQFPRIGFAYKINRVKGKPQHFPCSSTRFELFEHPSLWSSITLS
jgi:hypothetical protein